MNKRVHHTYTVVHPQFLTQSLKLSEPTLLTSTA